MGSRGLKVFKACKVMPVRKALRVCKETPARKEYKVKWDQPGRKVCRVIKVLRAIPELMGSRVF